MVLKRAFAFGLTLVAAACGAGATGCGAKPTKLDVSKISAYLAEQYPGADVRDCRKVRPSGADDLIVLCLLRQSTPSLMRDLESLSGRLDHSPISICFEDDGRLSLIGVGSLDRGGFLADRYPCGELERPLFGE